MAAPYLEEWWDADVELNHLRYFREVALAENISQAAKALYITQPALSVTIKKMETELGYALFIRKGNKIHLTEAGQCFLSYVNSIFSLLDEGIKKGRELATQADNVLRVASGFGVMRDITSDYLAQNPDLKIDLGCYPTDEIVARLAGGQADVGLILGKAHDIRLEERVIMSGKFYLCVNVEHPLAKKNVLYMADLEGQLIFCSNIAKTHETVSRIMRKAGVSCNLLTLDEKDVLFSAAVKGLGGVFCMPMLSVARSADMKGLCFIPIADCGEIGEVILLRPKDSYYTEEQEHYLRYIEQRFALNEQLLRDDWAQRGLA